MGRNEAGKKFAKSLQENGDNTIWNKRGLMFEDTVERKQREARERIKKREQEKTKKNEKER